ncbi:MAG: thioredoxin family protein [Candidatus Viridilinea halotolerans]|uniref:Thioredoxin family protein n=1 Tax=Candidatus Viridilinea halotolerans TaxID=2491704 RepID=A0A426TZ86_9CHLR|nr:MAG: thioredoxin family protein [Candidatus Viridilinea halotolerans]
MRLFLALLLLLSLSACEQQAATSTVAPQPTPPPTTDPLMPVVAVSELTLGPNRIALGLIRAGTPINDPDLELALRIFYLDGENPTEVHSESRAVYRGDGLPFGLYVGYADFDQPGGWGLELAITQGEGVLGSSRIRLDVKADSPIPAVGEAAIPSQNLTIRDVPDLEQLTSDVSPDPDFYQLTIAEALEAAKPFLVTFATPGYCVTAVCAPNQMVLKQLKAEYGAQVNFLHVEVFAYPFAEALQAQRYVPAMGEWGLRTEPWTFLVDAEGIIQARFEGGITFAEMEPALAQLATGAPVRLLLP